MPTAGDEGYEQLRQCPYDKSHEIRKGRMQFHLERCRLNFPTSQLVDCPLNKAHKVLQTELEYHVTEDCESRSTWDRFTHEADSAKCPVKDLVPVNAGTLPDTGENWDDFEAQGSVLGNIQAEIETKPVLRLKQVASKATRKEFRKQERNRFGSVLQDVGKATNEISDAASVVSDMEPLPRPKTMPNLRIIKQDPTEAVAAISKQFRTLDLTMKCPNGNEAPSDTSSLINHPPSEYETASTSRQPLSYAAASRAGPSRPASVLSSDSMVTARSQSRPSSGMSQSTAQSFATAVGPSRLPSASPGSVHSSMSSIASGSVRPPTSLRTSTAMSIASSVASLPRPADDEGFAPIPIPGLGRGRRPKVNN